jgi:site-specific recombinase XerD
MQSLKEYFENYINECQYVKRLRPETMKSSKEAFNHFVRIMPEISSLDEITHSVITVFFKRLQTRERIVGKGIKVVGIKDSTLSAYAGRLKTFFKWLKERKYIDENPFDNLRLPNPVFVDHRSLTGEQIKKIMGAAVQSAQNSFLLKRDLAMIGILTFCGLRRNELISLEVKDIDLFNGFITVQPETSKSKRLRKVPINAHLKIYLLEYLHERKNRKCTARHLFVSNGSDRGLTRHGLKHWVERISLLSGVKFHIHRFRHTFATNLAMQDVGAIKIQKLMGHADLKMTQTYLRSVSTEEMKEDINKLSFENLA